MVDVFISYSRTNEDVVARLAEAVKAEGYSVWWDAELPPHLSYGEVITEKIGAARAAIVVWSSAAAASEWVRAEADVARNQKKLIQVSVDDAMPPLPFNQIQFAPIGDWDGAPDHPGWRKVKASLAALCGPRGDAAAAPAPPAPRYVPPPPPPTPPAVPTAQAGRGNGLVIGLLALLVLLVGAGVYLLWLRDDAEPQPRIVEVERPSAQPAPVVRSDVPAPRRAPRRVAGADPPLVLPDSSSRVLTEEDLRPLGLAQLRMARNEIFARNGRAFLDPRLRRHFERYSWYLPRPGEPRLSAVEEANVRLIGEAERKR
jgi:hypothetical protein